MQSYPFTSRVTYDGQGLPQYDRAVDSAFLRKVFCLLYTSFTVSPDAGRYQMHCRLVYFEKGARR